MATLTIEPGDLIPALVVALQHPDVRAALGGDRIAPIAPRYMTTEQYAARLEVSTRCLRKWAAKGMPVVRIGGVVRIPVERADQWLESGGNVGAAVRRTLRAVGR